MIRIMKKIDDYEKYAAADKCLLIFCHHEFQQLDVNFLIRIKPTNTKYRFIIIIKYLSNTGDSYFCFKFVFPIKPWY